MGEISAADVIERMEATLAAARPTAEQQTIAAEPMPAAG
jgi:hypothetical protein